jgi:hypothetical protein
MCGAASVADRLVVALGLHLDPNHGDAPTADAVLAALPEQIALLRRDCEAR